MTHAGFTAVAACWVCGGAALSRIHEAVLDLDLYRDQHPDLAAYSGETVWFRQCAACGFTQPERLPAAPRFFDRLYDQLWSADWIQQEFESDYKDLIFATILNGLASRASTRGRLLDIGAHAGRFMQLAAAAGWQPEGIELNPRTAAFAAAHTGLPVHAINVDALVLSQGCYRAVSLIDVLEHVPHPVPLLSKVRDTLEPGGWIVVKVPSGPAQRLKEQARAVLRRGYRPRLADNLVHVNHFSPASLRTALARAGFGDAQVGIAPPELPPVRNAIGALSNFARRALYRVGRFVPGGAHTPVALNLLAFARRPSAAMRA